MAGMLTQFKKAMQRLEAEIEEGKKGLKVGKDLPKGHVERIEQLRLMKQSMKQAQAYALKVEELDLYQLITTIVGKGIQSVRTKVDIRKDQTILAVKG